MIRTSEFEQVTQIRMSRELDGAAVYWVAAYLVDGVLIDTGCSHTSKELTAFLENRNVRTVINTHYHEDHTGGNHDIMNAYHVDAYAHPEAIPLIARPCTLYPYQEIAWGYPVPTRVSPLPAELKTDRFTFRFIDTPGHCAGHVCPMELSRGWCFTGDLFARENPKFIRPEENVGEIIRSMRTVMEMGGDRLVLFTAVGKIIEDGKKALGDCIGYLAELAERAHAMKRSGLGLDEIVQGMFGGEHPFSGITNGQFSTFNLVRSLLDSVS
jgi:glyoxylase-like metal-dependent hydrolase (beta-lactamase superfamily II)